MAVRLTDEAARARHTIAWVGQAIVFYHRAGYGWVGWEPETTIVDHRWFQTIHGCVFYRVGTKREKNKNENTHVLDESKYMDFSIRVEQKKKNCHELLTFATRWRSVPATINITDKISTTDELVAIITRVWGHAQIVTGIVNQLVTTVGNSGRHPALNVCR